MRSRMIDSVVSYFFYNRRAWFCLLFCLRLLFILFDWNQRRRSLFSWWFFSMSFFWLDLQLFFSSTVFFVRINITFIYYSLTLTITMRCDREKIVDEKMSCWAKKHQIDCALCVFLKNEEKVKIQLISKAKNDFELRKKDLIFAFRDFEVRFACVNDFVFDCDFSR